MLRKKKGPHHVDKLLDELLKNCHSPDDILEKSSPTNQRKECPVERAS